MTPVEPRDALDPSPAWPPGWTVIARQAVGSTNDEARTLAVGGAADRTIVWADEQTGGRGRRGRAWASPPGNLYCSAILRPDCALAAAAELGFVVALAVAEAVARIAPGLAGLGLKWPNDVLAGKRKLAGILLESSGRADGRTDWVVVGCGVNLASHPRGAEYPATDLANEGIVGVKAADLLCAYLEALGGWLARWRRDGFPPVRGAWLDRAVGLGEAMTVRLDRETVPGRFVGLDEHGALRLGLAEGGERRITAGDVFMGDG
ncbi:MAG: biotin--[acetyl-CoA-carboxylase] ligase [Inquilinus sp.]|nr:biotin--[acetyl-CoA-carboxylase] ligase [Inquilinus sp.]